MRRVREFFARSDFEMQTHPLRLVFPSAHPVTPTSILARVDVSSGYRLYTSHGRGAICARYWMGIEMYSSIFNASYLFKEKSVSVLHRCSRSREMIEVRSIVCAPSFSSCPELIRRIQIPPAHTSRMRGLTLLDTQLSDT